MYCHTKSTQEWMKCLKCMPATKKSSNKRKVPANLEKGVYVYFRVKNELGMIEYRCEIKPKQIFLNFARGTRISSSLILNILIGWAVEYCGDVMLTDNSGCDIIIVIIVIVGRLNRVVYLVIVFNELSRVTSPFWSRNKLNRGIRLFGEAIDVVVPLLGSDSQEAIPFYLTWEAVCGFHCFAVETCIYIPWTHCDLFITWDGAQFSPCRSFY